MIATFRKCILNSSEENENEIKLLDEYSPVQVLWRVHTQQLQLWL